jgi:osmotically-inducible protein OsmY
MSIQQGAFMAMIAIKRLLVAVAAAGTLAGCGATATRSSTGEYFDDSVIGTKVKTALVKEGDVRARDVNVEVFRGTVQLSGFVRSEQERMRAEQIARQIAGVQAVKNDLQLRALQ